MQCYAGSKYTYGCAANTKEKKNWEFSPSENITNICLLIPHVRAEIRTQAFACQLIHLSSDESRARGNSSIGR